MKNIVSEAIGDVLKPKNKKDVEEAGGLFVNDVFFRLVQSGKYFCNLGRITYNGTSGEAAIVISDTYIDNQIGVNIRPLGEYNSLDIDFGYYLFPQNKMYSDIQGINPLTVNNLRKATKEMEIDKILTPQQLGVFLNPPNHSQLKNLIKNSLEKNKIANIERIKNIKDNINPGYYIQLNKNRWIGLGPFTDESDARFILTYAKNHDLVGSNYSNEIRENPNVDAFVSIETLINALENLMNGKTLFSAV